MGMIPSLSGPAPVYSDPGPDMRPRSADEIVDELIAVISADRVLDPDETRAVQRLLAVMQQIGAQRAIDQGEDLGQPMDNSNTEPFGATDGTEDPQASPEGQEPFGNAA